jgi:membrane protease YdiL (CAAX protease family)
VTEDPASASLPETSIEPAKIAPEETAPEETAPEEIPPRQRVPPWGWQDVGMVLGLGAPCFLIFEFLAVLAARMLHIPPADAVLQVLAQTTAYVALFSLLAYNLRIVYGAPFWTSLGWKRSPIGDGTAIALGPLIALSIAGLGGVLHVPDTDSPMKRILESEHGLITLAIFGITVAPLAEELLFRGFLQPLLARSLGAAGGIVVTGFLFGCLHGAQNAWSWSIVSLISMAGVAFGAIRYFGSTRASVLTHVAYNSTLFIALLSQGRNFKH